MFDDLMNIGTWINIATLLVAFFGFLALIFQNRRSKNIEECRFLLDLERSFSDNEKIKNIYHRLSVNDFSESESTDAYIYMSFFENLYPLIERKLIKYSEIDKMFGYRFFTAMHNEFMQSKIYESKAYFENLLALYNGWFEYRKNNNLEIPNKDNKLEL